jgi:hypothetical protein
MSKPVCILQSALFTRSGYGEWSLAMAKSLLRYGKFDLKIVPTRWGGCPSKTSQSDMESPEEVELFNRILRQPLQKQPEVFIQMTIPNEYQTPAKVNIGMTAGIETTVPPGEWIEGMNRMTANFVLSNFVKDVFQKTVLTKQNPNGTKEEIKLKKPIEVVNWGADTSVYKNTDEKCPSLDAELSAVKENFCFLFVGQWTHSNGLFSDRKDIGMLIKTFCEAFANQKNPPALIMKTSGVSFSQVDKHECLRRINAIKSQVAGELPNIYLLHGELSDVEMNALFNHEKVKCHVSFTHGEGYGHPLLLASLSGKPIMASDWSGHLDFLNKDNSYLLPGEIKPVRGDSVNQWIIKESSWFHVNYEKAKEKFRGMVTNYDKLTEKALVASIVNKEKFSKEAIDVQFHAMLDKYVPEFPVTSQIVLPKLKKLELPSLKKIELPTLKKV